MSVHPLAPDVRVRLLADLRARRGPFRHDVVSAYEVASHYATRRLPVEAFLREMAVRSRGGAPAGASWSFYILDPEVADLPLKALYDRYLVERGLPPKWGTGA